MISIINALLMVFGSIVTNHVKNTESHLNCYYISQIYSKLYTNIIKKWKNGASALTNLAFESILVVFSNPNIQCVKSQVLYAPYSYQIHSSLKSLQQGIILNIPRLLCWILLYHTISNSIQSPMSIFHGPLLYLDETVT
jgi:hypothetical protein